MDPIFFTETTIGNGVFDEIIFFDFLPASAVLITGRTAGFADLGG
jgi:hypothetical protein